jgi:hypothetical protein
MIRYFHRYKKSDPVQEPRFGYTVVYRVRYKDKDFQLASLFESEEEPLKQRRKAMEVFGETRKIIEFLTSNGFLGEGTIEFTSEIFSRIGNDEITIVGGGEENDLINLSLEFETLRTFGYISSMEPTMIVLDKDGKEVTILMTDLFY